MGFLSCKCPKHSIDNIFEFRRTSSKGTQDIQHIKNHLHEFHCWILNNIQENRERSLGITKLEECAMWLNKAISRQGESK